MKRFVTNNTGQSLTGNRGNISKYLIAKTDNETVAHGSVGRNLEESGWLQRLQTLGIAATDRSEGMWEQVSAL